jgi:hypothetical protein
MINANLESAAPTVLGQVRVKAVTHYGQTRIYPLCDRAKLFALIAGTTTLTVETLRLIDRMGFDIVIDGDATVETMLKVMA